MLSCCGHPTRMRLDPASTPLKLVLLTVLDPVLVFDAWPTSYEAARSEVRMHLSACSHVVDILQYTGRDM